MLKRTLGGDPFDKNSVISTHLSPYHCFCRADRLTSLRFGQFVCSKRHPPRGKNSLNETLPVLLRGSINLTDFSRRVSLRASNVVGAGAFLYYKISTFFVVCAFGRGK